MTPIHISWYTLFLNFHNKKLSFLYTDLFKCPNLGCCSHNIIAVIPSFILWTLNQISYSIYNDRLFSFSDTSQISQFFLIFSCDTSTVHSSELTYIIEVSGLIVIVLRNGHSNPGSNPGRDCLYFTFMLMPFGKAWIHLFCPQLSANNRVE